MRRAPLLLALVAGALVALLVAAPAAAMAAPTLVQVGDFNAPIYVTAPPLDTSRVFVVERGGTIREIKDGVKLATPFLDVTRPDRRHGRGAGPPVHGLRAGLRD